MLPAVAVLRSQMATPELSPKRRLSTITKKDAKGKEVPKDVVRRMEAEAEDPNNGVDRPLQLACIAARVVPLAWAGATQEAPTAGEQLSGWAADSWTQLTDGKLTASFQLAAALLFIERLCYTWVHTFSASFSRFCKSAVGQAMGGEKPLDVVLKLFWANKVIQLGTFTVWYFYVIDFASPFDSGFSWAGVTRLRRRRRRLRRRLHLFSHHLHRYLSSSTARGSTRPSTARSARRACTTATASGCPPTGTSGSRSPSRRTRSTWASACR